MNAALKIEFKIQRRRKNVLASLLWLKSTRLSNIFGDFISKEVTKLVKNTLNIIVLCFRIVINMSPKKPCCNLTRHKKLERDEMAVENVFSVHFFHLAS